MVFNVVPTILEVWIFCYKFFSSFEQLDFFYILDLVKHVGIPGKLHTDLLCEFLISFHNETLQLLFHNQLKHLPVQLLPYFWTFFDRIFHPSFQISMVAGILAYKFGAPFAWITSLSVAAYVTFTLSVTQVLYLLPFPYYHCAHWLWNR